MQETASGVCAHMGRGRGMPGREYVVRAGACPPGVMAITHTPTLGF